MLLSNYNKAAVSIPVTERSYRYRYIKEQRVNFKGATYIILECWKGGGQKEKRTKTFCSFPSSESKLEYIYISWHLVAPLKRVNGDKVVLKSCPGSKLFKCCPFWWILRCVRFAWLPSSEPITYTLDNKITQDSWKSSFSTMGQQCIWAFSSLVCYVRLSLNTHHVPIIEKKYEMLKQLTIRWSIIQTHIKKGHAEHESEGINQRQATHQ